MISCQTDEPNNDNSSTSGSSNSNSNTGSNNGQTQASVESLINSKVSASSSYKDFTFTFTIKSQLQSELPGSNIQFGVGHNSTNGLSNISVSVGNQAYSYSSSSSGTQQTVTIKNPFWFYYLFTAPNSSKAATSEGYYNQYLALAAKGYYNLTSEEKELYNGANRILTDYEKDAKSYYKPTIYVVVDGKYYQLNSYRIP